MFKTKWQKKYEMVMEDVEFRRDYYREHYNKLCEDSPASTEERLAIITLDDLLRDMKRIAEG